MKINSFLLRCTLIAALGGFLFGFETAVISGAEKTIQQLWSLSDFWLGFTVAASLIGTVIGSMIAGNPAQRYGRKKVLMFIAVCICSLHWVVHSHRPGYCLSFSVWSAVSPSALLP